MHLGHRQSCPCVFFCDCSLYDLIYWLSVSNAESNSPLLFVGKSMALTNAQDSLAPWKRSILASSHSTDRGPAYWISLRATMISSKLTSPRPTDLKSHCLRGSAKSV